MPLTDLKFSKLIYLGLKLAELVLGAIYLGVVSYHTTVTVSGEVFVYGHTKVMSFVTVTAGFMVPTFLLMIIQFHAPSAEKQRKSIFEMLFNLSAVVFLVAASTTMLSFTEKLPEDFPGHTSWRAGGILGVISIVLFFQDIKFATPEQSYALAAFFICILTTLLAAFLLLLSYVISPMSAESLPKSLFELLHSIYSFLFFMCASLALLIIFSSAEYEDKQNDAKYVIPLIVLGFGNGVLYFLSSFFGYKSFRSS